MVSKIILSDFILITENMLFTESLYLINASSYPLYLFSSVSLIKNYNFAKF